MSKVYVETRANVRLLKVILKPFGVTTRQNEFGYKEMIFDQPDSLFSALQFLALEGIAVRALSLYVETEEGDKQFTNTYHTQYSQWYIREEI